MLSNFAQYLWNFLLWLRDSSLSWCSNALSNLFNFFGNLFSTLMTFLGGLTQSLLNGIASVLKALFKPILDFLGAIFHLIVRLTEFLGLLLQLFLQIGHLIIAFIQGLFSTLSGLNYNGSTPAGLDSNMQGSADAISQAMSILQMDNLAYLALFAIWLSTAIAVIRMIGNFNSGGGD